MKRQPVCERGFSLVEVALALGIAAFGLVSVFGLLPAGINSNQASSQQTGAANVASAVAADLRATALAMPPTNQTSPLYQIPVPGPVTTTSPFVSFFARQDGALTGTMGTDAVPSQKPRYRVTLFFSPAANNNRVNTSDRNAVAVRVLITWPALADPQASAAPTKYAGSFQTFVGLIRN